MILPVHYQAWVRRKQLQCVCGCVCNATSSQHAMLISFLEHHHTRIIHEIKFYLFVLIALGC